MKARMAAASSAKKIRRMSMKNCSKTKGKGQKEYDKVDESEDKKVHVHVFKKEKERKVKNRILVVLTSLSTKTAYKSILLFWLSVSRLTERIINTHTHTSEW